MRKLIVPERGFFIVTGLIKNVLSVIFKLVDTSSFEKNQISILKFKFHLTIFFMVNYYLLLKLLYQIVGIELIT